MLWELPVEIIEMICDFTVDVEPHYIRGHFVVEQMGGLRFTSRAVAQLTFKWFATHAFRTRFVRFDLRSLENLLRVSNTPEFANSIRRIAISCSHDKHSFWSFEEYETVRQSCDAPERSLEQRRDLLCRFRTFQEEANDKEFFERSGTANFFLTSALRNLRNLETVVLIGDRLDPRGRVLRHYLSDAPASTTSHKFSILCAALVLSPSKPKELRVYNSEALSCNDSQGLTLQALCMPQRAMACFSQLVKLNLFLQPRDKGWHSPLDWNSHLAVFLGHCSKLRELSLKFRLDDWVDTEPVFERIACDVQLPDLKQLQLEMMRIRGKDLEMFLGRHLSLKKLHLSSLDIAGPGQTAFARVLKTLHDRPSVLTWFSCDQISQNALRLYFESLGTMYYATAEEREGRSKMALLRNDLRVSNESNASDDDDVHGEYIWLEPEMEQGSESEE